MRAEILTSLVGRFQGGSNWKNAVFIPGLTVTIVTDFTAFTPSIPSIFLSAVCFTPGVQFEWFFKGSSYDVGRFTTVTNINYPGPDIYTVKVTDPVSGATGFASITITYDY